ncbi:hypothetical protein [Azorhizobium doebereinerae]|uniref:hypothetical protein n=1 Tax=Azorhizobium doebereinerae TaxID=281091 RepID=UPI00041AD643|nr:hypothetical protein [Azorhizobium doebereinerae]
MSQDVAMTERPRRAERPQVIDAVPMLDTAMFEQMQRIATIMAQSSLIPESLYMTGPKRERVRLPYESVFANCFLVVNQAFRWGMDPFAVAQCVSVVHGRLCYEGKLIAAVIESKAGVRLHHYFNGQGEQQRIWLTDVALTEQQEKELVPGAQIRGVRMLDGSVAEWKTTGDGSPWTPNAYRRQLIYRGTRDWTRINEPALLLGVYSDDELQDLADDARARRAAVIGGAEASGLAARLQQSQAAALPSPGLNAGFSMDKIQREMETVGRSETSAAANTRTAEPARNPEGVRDNFAGGTANTKPASTSTGGDHVKDQALAGASRPSSGQDNGSTQTSADPGVTSAGGEQPATASEISPTAIGETEDGNASRPTAPLADADPSSTPSMTAEMFSAYSLALARATKKVSLTNFGQKAGEAIIASLRGQPGAADMGVVRQIFALHERRIEGSIAAAEIADLVDGLVEQHLGGVA